MQSGQVTINLPSIELQQKSSTILARAITITIKSHMFANNTKWPQNLAKYRVYFHNKIDISV
jgi:cAMP phosphodiesterase